MDPTLKLFEDFKLSALIRSSSAEDAEEMIKAAAAGGIRIFEIFLPTLTTHTKKAVAQINEKFQAASISITAESWPSNGLGSIDHIVLEYPLLRHAAIKKLVEDAAPDALNCRAIISEAQGRRVCYEFEPKEPIGAIEMNSPLTETLQPPSAEKTNTRPQGWFRKTWNKYLALADD